MSDFELALPFVFGVEKGLSNNAVDHGGRTNLGITQSIFDMWRDSRHMARADVATCTHDEAADIYRQWYWTPACCDLLPQKLATCLFDAMVNHRPIAAIALMQGALGVTADGVIGQKTRDAFRAAADTQSAIRGFIDLRINLFFSIVQHDLAQLTFLHGWVNRALHLERALA